MSTGSKFDAFNPAKKVGSLLDEFKAFAFKGSVIDLAIGVIIGAAFGAIVKSLVDNIIMPLVSVILPGEKGYESWQWVIASHMDNAGATVIDKAIPYGKFLAEVMNFLIVACVLFLFIKKFLGWVLRSKQQAAAAPPPPTKEQELLMEIRDLLKQRAV